MPPADTFFYPSSAFMPDGQWLYVANSNADLRFNDGTLAMVNVGTDVGYQVGAASDRQRPWGACPQVDYVNPLPRSDAPICCWDALDSNILNCDERRYIVSDATVRIGSFAGGIAWQNYCASDPCNPSGSCAYDPKAGRLFIGVRGNTSLTWVDVAPPADPSSPPTINCRLDGTTGKLAECTQIVTDTSSNLNSETGDPNAPQVNLPDEPYALETDPELGLLYVGHLVGNTSVVDSGGISLFNISGTSQPGDSSVLPPAPTFIAPFSSPFPANGAGSFGVTAIRKHTSLNGGSNQELYVSSRYVPTVASMVPFVPPNNTDDFSQFVCRVGGQANTSDLVVLPSSDSLNSGLTGSEMRGVEFDPPVGTPKRVFALQRVPPDLVTFEVTTTENGATVPIVSSLIETCSSPTFLYQDPRNSTRLYVNCFDTGEMYVIDTTIPSLVTTFSVGRGPGGMVFDPNLPVGYVVDFSQNDVVVVDLTPGSPTEDHVIQRLGFPSISPR